jgi:hypothetical protein
MEVETIGRDIEGIPRKALIHNLETMLKKLADDHYLFFKH